MTRRADSRIEMKLPCHVIFPEIWKYSMTGVTANLHRTGVLIECTPASPDHELPAVGQHARVRIDLPPNPAFTPKCIDCETTLLRVRRAGAGEWQFALRIREVNFNDRPMPSRAFPPHESGTAWYVA